MSAQTFSLKAWPTRQPLAFLVLAAMAWFAIYQTLMPASEALVTLLPVERESHLGGALQFFLYDTPKVLMLLTGVVFAMGMVNSLLHTRAHPGLAGGSNRGAGHVMAASLGIVTPFCSCSAVPLSLALCRRACRWGCLFLPDLGAHGQ